MGNSSQKKNIVTFVEKTETLNHETGEMTASEKTTKMRFSVEPSYVKLYLDCLLTFKNLSTSLNPILLETLKFMRYASPDFKYGGQTINITMGIKEEIAFNTKVTVGRVNQALGDFVKTGVFKRLRNGTFQVNPNLFGKGDWKDIKSLRSTFDFSTGDVLTEVTSENNVEFRPIEKLHEEAEQSFAKAKLTHKEVPFFDLL